jgi:sodium/proline symporter
VILFAPLSRRTTWPAALLGMVAGTVVLILWKRLGLSDHLYELAPGFPANCMIILIANRVVQQDNPLVLRQFDEMAAEARQAPAYDTV